MSVKVEAIAAFTDNYIWLGHDLESGHVFCVDPGQAEPVMAYLNKNKLKLDTILITHHHSDHIGGLEELKKIYDCRVIGPEYDKNRIPGIDQYCKNGDVFNLEGQDYEVLYLPAHTLGHIVFWNKVEKILFCGDTIFSMGCGRLFEGSAEQLWHALCKLISLPEETRLYCTHEYTLENARFALTVEPHNEALQKRFEEVKKLRNKGEITLPVSIALELETNPFLRPKSFEIRRILGLETASDAEVVAELRSRKDKF